MQPVFYSMKDAEEGNPGWERIGVNICYYRNHYARKNFAGQANKLYHTTTFSIVFPYANDTCYLAYHYPYSFSMLLVSLDSPPLSLNC